MMKTSLLVLGCSSALLIAAGCATQPAAAPDRPADGYGEVEESVSTAERSERIEDPEGLLEEMRDVRRRPQLTDEEAVASPGVLNARFMTKELFAQVMGDGGQGRHIVFIGSDGCGASKAFGPRLEPLLEAAGVLERVINVTSNHPSDEYLRSFGFPVAFPSLVAIEGGKVVDVQIGGYSEDDAPVAVEHFLVRNGFVEKDEELANLYDLREMEPERLRRWVRNARGASLTNLQDADLSGVEVIDGRFTATNLRGANLSDARFVNAMFSRADLTGATIEGANFEGAIWINTICPDGSLSQENGDTCVDANTDSDNQ